jgi:chitodextrinase
MRRALLVRGALAAALALSLYACDNDEAKPPAGPAGPEGADTEAPSVPLDLVAAPASETSMDVTWSPSTDDVGVAGYRVYRDGAAVGVSAATSYLDAGLAAGTSYSYRVSAFDTSGNESARSSPATGTTSGGIPSGGTYLVGPSRTYTSIQQVEGLLEPGDLVLVDGDEVYAGSITFSNAGTPAEPITIRGVKTNGIRPVIEGGRDVVEFNQNNYVFEGFEIRNAGFRGLYHHADNVTIRDCVVHDCPHGILGADQGSGDLTLEYCEIHHCGEGDSRHQIYISTNEDDYPGSVFRMRFCYVHDGTGGNNVKSRAERTEIYYNWFENPYYHNLELIGPDPAGGVAEDKAREDGDVVGNVIIAKRYSRNVRIGGDGTGQSFGRYRFVNNTFIHRNADPASQIFAHFDVESVEMHNNVFYMPSGDVFDDSEASWVYGRRVSGSDNWVRSGAGFPAEWTGTLAGADPGFADLANDLLRPAAGSILVDAGTASMTSPPGSPFLNPLAVPLYHPPEAALIAVGTAEHRPADGAIDIGAFERE